jgi:hypothetical protein
MLVSSASSPPLVTGTPAALVSLASVDTNCATRKMAPQALGARNATGTATMTGVNKPTGDPCPPLLVANVRSSNLLLLLPGQLNAPTLHQPQTATGSQENVTEKTTTAALPTANKKSPKMRPGTTTTARSVYSFRWIHCLICYAGVSVLKTGAEDIHEELQQSSRLFLILYPQRI